MIRVFPWVLAGLISLSCFASLTRADDNSRADDKTTAAAKSDTKQAVADKDKKDEDASASSAAAAGATPAKPKPKYPPYTDVIGEAKAMEGLIKLQKKDARLLAELSPSDLNRDYIVVIAIARGIGENPLIGGMTWGFGDDWVWQFRKTEDRIQIVRRNIRFRANKGTPIEKAVYFAYTDSVLFSLPILTTSPSGAYVVDLTSVFMSDLAQISTTARGFSFSPDRSTWAFVKNYKDNIELEVAATYSAMGSQTDNVIDSRGATINVHYSISRMPDPGYQPRQADDRIGYFVTALKDFSKQGKADQFVRYINRWNLKKADPTLSISPPVTPVIFWIEKNGAV